MDLKLNKIFTAITYIAMVVMNYLANALPLNNRSTGAISDSYPNLFAPAGITFSIWGIIYLALGLFILYQFGVFGKLKKKENNIIKKVNKYFIITSLANIAWLFSWHYDLIGLSVLLMGILLLGLITITNILAKEKFTRKEYVFKRIPFSIYFGWITIATIANITTYMVSINWNGFGIADNIWTIIIILLGSIIGIVTTIKHRDIAYALVLIWAFIGIIIKHTSNTGFANSYPMIINTTLFCIAIIIVTIVFVQKKLIEQKHNI